VGAADISALAGTSALTVTGRLLLIRRAVGEVYRCALMRQPVRTQPRGCLPSRAPAWRPPSQIKACGC